MLDLRVSERIEQSQHLVVKAALFGWIGITDMGVFRNIFQQSLVFSTRVEDSLFVCASETRTNNVNAVEILNRDDIQITVDTIIKNLECFSKFLNVGFQDG